LTNLLVASDPSRRLETQRRRSARKFPSLHPRRPCLRCNCRRLRQSILSKRHFAARRYNERGFPASSGAGCFANMAARRRFSRLSISTAPSDAQPRSIFAAAKCVGFRRAKWLVAIALHLRLALHKTGPGHQDPLGRSSQPAFRKHRDSATGIVGRS
jgi:hypothetical protein